jgi:hypothetical protein
MSKRLRLADLLGSLSIVSNWDTAYQARQMRLPEREVADVFYVSLLFHVGSVG